MSNSLKNLQITCANNSTAIAFLKQENQRLSDIIKNSRTGNNIPSSSPDPSHQSRNAACSSISQCSNNNPNFQQIDLTALILITIII